MSILRFDGVGKTYAGGREALRNVTFSVAPGEMLFITGHSGAGKSTLLKLIQLTDRPSLGSVLFDDAVVAAGAVVRDSVVGRGARVGAGVSLDGVVVGDGATIEAGNELVHGARVWPGVTLAATSVRFSSDR